MLCGGLRTIFALAALVAVCAPCGAEGVRFALPPGSRRCFTEDFPSATTVQASVRVSDGKGAMDIDVWVTTMQGHVLYHHRAPDHGRFKFQTPPATRTDHSGIDPDDIDSEDYGWSEDTFRICIEHQMVDPTGHEVGMHRYVTLALDEHFMERETARRVDGSAKASDGDKLESAVRGMHDSMTRLVADLGKLQAREHALVKQVKKTSSRVSLLSSISIAAAVVTSAAQYQYYRAYFTQKKLC